MSQDEKNTSSREVPSEAEFIELYGATQVSFNQLTLPLSTYVQMEQRFCTATSEKREDPEARVAFLARTAGVENLHPDHQWLAAPIED